MDTKINISELTFSTSFNLRPEKKAIDKLKEDGVNVDRYYVVEKKTNEIKIKAKKLFVKFDFSNVDKNDLAKVLEAASSLTVQVQGKLRALGPKAIHELKSSADEPIVYDVKELAKEARRGGDPVEKATSQLGKLDVSEAIAAAKAAMKAKGMSDKEIEAAFKA